MPCAVKHNNLPVLCLQIDLRFANPEQGDLEVVVAPIMRFMNIDFNANVKIEDVAPPERIIDGFALEIFGGPLTVGESMLCTSGSRSILRL